MGGEDGRLVGVGLVGQPVLQRVELHQRPVDGVVEAPALAVPVAGVLLDLEVLVPDLHHGADAQARRGGDARAARSGRRNGAAAPAAAATGAASAACRFGRLPRRSGRRPPRRARGELRGQVRDRLVGVRAVGDDLHLVAVPHLHPHDRHHALGVGLVVAALERDLALVLRGEVGQHRRRPGVQADRVAAPGSRPRSPSGQPGFGAPRRRPPQPRRGSRPPPTSRPAVTSRSGAQSPPAGPSWRSPSGSAGSSRSSRPHRGRRSMSSSPACTWSPTFTLTVKPSPFICTVSSPMWVSTSRPSGDRTVNACAAGWRWITSPSQGATSVLLSGSIEIPSPTIFCGEDRIRNLLDRHHDPGDRGHQRHRGDCWS